MKCNCIEEVTKKLKEATGDNEASIEVGFVQVGNSFVTLPVIAATYREKKQDGTLKAKPSKNPLIVTFCPFCGKSVK